MKSFKEYIRELYEGDPEAEENIGQDEDSRYEEALSFHKNELTSKLPVNSVISNFNHKEDEKYFYLMLDFKCDGMEPSDLKKFLYEDIVLKAIGPDTFSIETAIKKV